MYHYILLYIDGHLCTRKLVSQSLLVTQLVTRVINMLTYITFFYHKKSYVKDLFLLSIEHFIFTCHTLYCFSTPNTSGTSTRDM